MKDVFGTSAAENTYLGQQDAEFFLAAIETATRIRKRFQFYLWTQGALQSFLPHETLICVIGTPGSMHARYEVSTRSVADETEIQNLYNHDKSLFALLWVRWMDCGQIPFVVLDTDERIGTALARHGISSALCHGVKIQPDDKLDESTTGSFFAFLQIPENLPITRLCYLTELLLPHLHIALLQISELPTQKSAHPSSNETGDLLSERERDVLRWIKAGKTNQEIGLILAISPMTVKNHVQKILRKLNVSNRAQAAAYIQDTHAKQQPAPRC
jgi:transcriptional regulator EpsA